MSSRLEIKSGLFRCEVESSPFGFKSSTLSGLQVILESSGVPDVIVLTELVAGFRGLLRGGGMASWTRRREGERNENREKEGNGKWEKRGRRMGCAGLCPFAKIAARINARNTAVLVQQARINARNIAVLVQQLMLDSSEPTCR